MVVLMSNDKEKTSMRKEEDEFEDKFIDEYSVVSPHEPPTLEDTSWDADSAEASLRRWAGGPDKDDINWTDYRKGFLYYDSGNIEQWGSYYFPHHKIQDGELVTSERGVITAGNYLQGARGFDPDQLPDEVLSRARSHLARHYTQFDRTPPWRETDEEEESLQEEETWTRSDAESWLADNDFQYTGTVGGDEIPIVGQNFYNYRQLDPDLFDEFRRDESPFGFDEGDGVHATYGIGRTDDDDEDVLEVQSIHFYHGRGDEDEQEQENAEFIGAGKYRCPNCGVYLRSPKVEMCNNCGEEVDPFEAINPIRLQETDESEIKIVKHWKRGELIKKDEKVVHYDIFFSDKHFVASDNPIENETICSLRKPYKKNFIDEIDREIKFINKNEVAAINNNESWMKTLYSNKGKILKSEDCYAIEVQDKILCISEDEEKDNLWKANTIELDECCEFKTEYKFQKIEKGKMLLSMNSTPIDVNSVQFNDNEVVVSGMIISEGSWNGVWFSEEVLKELTEDELRDISIDVGTHDNKEEDVGEILDIQWIDDMKGWYFEVRIEDEASLERLQEMDSPGFSIETDIYVDRERNKVEEVASISSAVIVPNPACKVCYIDEE